MWLIDLFKKKEDVTVVAHNHAPIEQQLLLQCLEFVPGHFRGSVFYADAIGHLSHKQYADALGSLVKMADQPGFFFNNDYWLELKHLATKLGLQKEIAVCDRKLEENKINNIVLYKGIVIEEVADGMYKHYISDSLSNEKNEERRLRDGLKELMGTDGFHIRALGKEGTIYHVHGKRVCEIRYQQLSETHFVVYSYSLEYLALPIRQRLGDPEKEALHKELLAWFKTQGITAEFQ